ncbi:MAG: SurA N-terminal domain-containing protein [Actinomycetes bacterium]|jgi:foldase protein PrsA|nr:SurA N-terminal domain-containing protein [Actinomycetes bacterium]
MDDELTNETDASTGENLSWNAPPVDSTESPEPEPTVDSTESPEPESVVAPQEPDEVTLTWDRTSDEGAEPSEQSLEESSVNEQTSSELPNFAEPGKTTHKNRIWLFAGIGALVVVIAVVAVVLLSKNGGFVGLGQGELAAKVNNEVITVKQLDAEIAKIKLQSPQIFDAETGMEEAVVRKSLLDELINRLLIEETAAKEGIEVGDTEVQEQIDSIKAGYEDEAAFDEALKNAGYTVETLSSQIRYDLFLQGLITKTVPDDSVTDADAQAYYDANKTEFVEAAGKKASHILFDANDKEKAQGVLDDLKKSTDLEKDFAEAAKEHSTDTATAENGGDLGWPTTGYVEAFQAALDKLDIDEISNLVKTEFGYHIIMATDERQESTKSFDEVQQEIKDQLLNTKRSESYQELLESLRASAKIEILDPAIVAYDKEQQESTTPTPDSSGTDSDSAPVESAPSEETTATE